MQDTNNLSGNTASEEISIDITEIMSAILSKIRTIIIVTLLAGLLGFILSDLVVAPTYNSTTSIYVLNKRGENLTVGDTQLATQLTKDYEKLITGRYVLETVLNNVGSVESYEKFKNRVKVSNETDTRILEIIVTDESPREAQLLANTIRIVATDYIKKVTDVEAINVAEEANLPDTESGPSVKRWTIIGAGLGFLLSVCYVVIRFLLDDTIKTSEDVEKYLGLSTIALVPDGDKIDNKEKSKKGGKSSSKNKKTTKSKNTTNVSRLKF